MKGAGQRWHSLNWVKILTWDIDLPFFIVVYWVLIQTFINSDLN